MLVQCLRMLTLEYIPDGSELCPLIRLFGFEAADVVALRELCLSLAEGRVTAVSLEGQSWVRAVGGCRLVLRAGDRNRGIRASKQGGDEGARVFEMEYAREGWLEVADKLAPFASGLAGFQWLTNEGDVRLLVSRSGEW